MTAKPPAPDVSGNDVLTQRIGPVLRITLNRPARRNAITNELCDELREIFETHRHDTSIRCAVLTGAGEAFCAGGDLKPGTSPFEVDFNDIGTRYAAALMAGKTFPVPVVARVNGACMAGGMGLLAMCDLAVASEDVKFGLPEVRIGVFPFQVAPFLRQRIAEHHLADLAYTGRHIDAFTAQSMGLLNRVVPRTELDSAVAEYVDAIAAAAPNAVRRGKYGLAHMQGMSLRQALGLAESLVVPMSLADDAREGIASFNEKRRPTWRGAVQQDASR